MTMESTMLTIFFQVAAAELGLKGMRWKLEGVPQYSNIFKVIRGLTTKKRLWTKYCRTVPGMEYYLWPASRPMECVACWFEATGEGQGRHHSCHERPVDAPKAPEAAAPYIRVSTAMDVTSPVGAAPPADMLSPPGAPTPM